MLGETMSKKIPVLVLAFNRPDHVQKAMEPIRQYKPDRIYLECDGARLNKPGEKEAVEATRKMMIDMVDWPCEMKTLFRNENMGCANGVFDAISWFFKHEEYGIICEDDVILGSDFFLFCEELLSRYAKNEKIMQISARNTSFRTDIDNSYVFAECFHCWGWATWRRAWLKMDMSMSAVQRISWWNLSKRLGWFRSFMMMRTFKNGYNHLSTFSSWATRWYLSILDNNGLVLCPGVNLAVNIGTDGGTHFDSYDNNRPGAKLKIGTIMWPLVYNDRLVVDQKQKKYDSEFFCQNRIFGLKKKIKKIVDSRK